MKSIQWCILALFYFTVAFFAWVVMMIIFDQAIQADKKTEIKPSVCCQGLPNHTYEMTPAEKKQYNVKE